MSRRSPIVSIDWTESQCFEIISRACFSNYIRDTLLHWPNQEGRLKRNILRKSEKKHLQTCFNKAIENLQV